MGTIHLNNTNSFLPLSQQVSLLSCVAIFICWLLPGLLGHEPWKPDEAYTFGLIRHIVQTGNWVVPTLAGEPFMEKPPIYFIVAAGFLRLFSPWLGEPDAARLASGMFILIASLAVAFSARTLWGNGAGRWAVMILIACIGLPIRAHQTITDTALLAGIAVGIYGFIQGVNRPVAGGLLLGVGAALAFLSKGLLGPGILGLTALMLPLCASEFRRKRYVFFCLIAMLAFIPLVLPWLYALWLSSEKLFSTWLLVNNFGRFNGSAGLGPSREKFFYFRLLPWYAFPALPMAAWWLWRARKTGIGSAARVPLIFFLCGFSVLSLASDGRELYAMPLLPPLAMLAVGACIHKPAWAEKLRPWLTSTFGVLTLLFWFAGIILMTGWPRSLWDQWVAPSAPGFTPHIHPVWFTMAIIITLLLGGLVFLSRAGRQSLVFIFSCCVTLCWALGMTLGMPYLDYTNRYSDVFTQMGSHLQHHGCVASRHLGEPQRALIEYYDGITTLREEEHSEAHGCEWLIYQHNKKSPEESIDGTLIWQGERHGDKKEEYRLYHLNR